MRRLSPILFTLVAVLGLPALATGQGDQAATPATLTPEDPPGTVDFGEERDPKTINLLFSSSAALESPPTVTVVNTVDESDHQLFKGTVTATAELTGDSEVKVPVVVDPADRDDGTYTTSLRLVGSKIQNTSATVKTSYHRSLSDTGAWILAAAALILGLVLGGLLRWFAERATKLRDLLREVQLLESALPAPDLRPPGLVRDLNRVQVALIQGNASGAEELLKTVKEKQADAFAALDFLAELKTRLAEQESAIAAMPELGSKGADLREVVRVEREQLLALAREAYPDPAPQKDAREKLALSTKQYREFLTEYANPENRDRLEEALLHFKRGEFQEGHTKAFPPRAGAGAGAPGAPEETEALVESKGGLFRRFKWWTIRNASLFLGILIGIGFLILGLETVFKPGTMFLTNDVLDVLALIAWGFASAVVGTTTTDLAGKLKPQS